MRGLAKERWGELTEDDLDQVDGRRLGLIGRLQARYGKDLARAEHEVNAWLESLQHSPPGG